MYVDPLNLNGDHFTFGSMYIHGVVLVYVLNCLLNLANLGD